MTTMTAAAGTRATAEERALARAVLYRLLSLSFGYPTSETVDALRALLPAAEAAAALTDRSVEDAVVELAEAVHQRALPVLEHDHQRVFTLSYSEDNPPYETAFSARHLYQQSAQQADIAGFYRAFGVSTRGERPDYLPMELEFAYVLVLKEAYARRSMDKLARRICRDAQRRFLRAHLARWAPLVGQRVLVADRGTFLEPAARLLLAFVWWEERFLRLGAVSRFEDQPTMIADPPGDDSCPMSDCAPTGAVDLPFFEDREGAQDASSTAS